MRGAALIATAAALAAPASASAFDFTVHANGRMSAANVARIERAVSYQVNVQVAREWPDASASPLTFSATGGDPITLVSHHDVSHWFASSGGTILPFDVIGFHYTGDNGAPAIVVWGEDFYDTAITVSHEAVEAEVDPLGGGGEIADPVENGPSYSLWGVPVANWVLPSGQPFHRAS